MIKSILIIGMMFITGYAKTDIIDFGIEGKMYDIKEEDAMKVIKRRISNIKFQKDFKEKIKKAVKEASIGKTDLPYGTKLDSYQEDNYEILTRDIKNPLGRIYKKKGERVLINRDHKLDICFIDGKNKILLKNQIKYFDEVVKKKSGKYAECTYMVSNKSVLELGEEYYPRSFYPSKKQYEDKFMVKYLPTYIHIENGKRSVFTFPMDMFKHEVKVK